MAMYEAPIGQRADWVVVGACMGPGKVMILASTDLTHAELDAEVDYYEDRGGLAVRARVEYSIRCEMRRLVIVEGVDYADAWSKLLGFWRPDRAGTERSSLGPASQAIEGRR